MGWKDKNKHKLSEISSWGLNQMKKKPVLERETSDRVEYRMLSKIKENRKAHRFWYFW